MSLSEKIAEQMKDAMRAKAADRLSALRLIKSELAKAELDQGKKLDAGAEQDVLKRMAKQRRESIDSFRAGGREEMARKEEDELKVLLEFLPSEIPQAEIDRIIDACIAAMQPVDASKMGQVVGAVMKELKATGGLFDGKAVNQSVREKLNS